MTDPSPAPQAQLTITSPLPVQDTSVLAALLSLQAAPPEVPLSRAQFTLQAGTVTTLVLPTGATSAVLTLEGEGRYAVVEPEADASSGHQVFVGDILTLNTPEELLEFSMYAATDGKLEVTFYAPRQVNP